MSTNQPEEGSTAEKFESRPHCQECGQPFDPAFAKDGTHCFGCSVHLTCACADPIE